MKKLFLVILVLATFKMAKSQTYCESFDGQAVTTQDGGHAFNTFGNGNGGFLNDWNVTNGTPSIYLSGQLTGVNAFNGNQFVLNAVCDNGASSSEGLSLQHNFIQGNTYNVSIAIRNHGISTNPTPIDVEFILLDSALSFTYQTQTGCTQTPSIPNSALTVHTESVFAADSWQVITFSIANLTADYHNLWIRSTFSQGSPLTTTFLLLDSVCVETVVPSTCYTFDEQQITTNESAHTFNDYGNGNAGFLQDWNVVSGTPSIYLSGSLGGINAFEGSQFVLQAICNSGANFDESVSLAYNFQQGHSYTVSMAVRNHGTGSTPTPIDVDFILLTDSIPYAYNTGTGCSQIPNTPIGADTVHTLSGLNQDSWQVITFNINSLTADYGHLWFRGQFSSGSPLVTTFFLFDSVCVTELPIPTSLTDKIAQRKLAIYPNPATQTITIDSEINLGTYKIQNITGKELLAGDFSNGNNTFDVSTLNNGIYFFVLQNSAEVVTKKFVVER